MLVVLWIWPGSDAHRVRLAAVIAAVAALVALGLDQPINHLVGRARPYTGHHVHLLLARSGDNSFPSDHTAFAVAVAAALWPVRRWLSVTLGVLGLSVGFARVVCGVHYPGDVLGGAIVGAVAAVLVWIVLRRPLGALVSLGERVWGALGRPFARAVART